MGPLTPFVMQLVAGLVLWLATIVFTWMAAHGVFTEEQSKTLIGMLTDPNVISWIVGLLITGGLILRSRARSHQMKLTALAMPEGKSFNDLVAVMNDKQLEKPPTSKSPETRNYLRETPLPPLPPVGGKDRT